MSQQHPTYLTHISNAVQSRQSTVIPVGKNVAVTSAFRVASHCHAVLVPPETPPLSSVSVTLTASLPPTAFCRSPVISAICPVSPSSAIRPPAPVMVDHARPNFVIHGSTNIGSGAQGSPLQITLTQHINPSSSTATGVQDATTALGMKLTGRQLRPSYLPGSIHRLAAITVPAAPTTASMMAINLTTNLQSKVAMSSALKATSVRMNPTSPAVSNRITDPLPPSQAIDISITSHSSAMMSQQQLLSQDLYTPSTIQPKTSSVAFTSSPAIAMTAAYTRAAYPTIDFASASGVTSTSSPSLTNIAFSLLQHERHIPSSALNVAAAPSAGIFTQNQDMWHVFYQQATHPQLTSAVGTISQHMVQPASSTFFVNRPAIDQSIMQAQTANLTAASLLHAVTPCSAVTPCQPLLFKAQVMMDSLQQTMPPITATVVACTGFDLVSAMSSQANNFSTLSAVHQINTDSMQVHQSIPTTPSGSNVGMSASCNASPRPSILRKRNVDGSTAVQRKQNVYLSCESHSPRSDSNCQFNITSPKNAATENSQSSTDTALSSNDATTPTHLMLESKIKTDLTDSVDNGCTTFLAANQGGCGDCVDASPRKRARKQLFDVRKRNLSEMVSRGNSSTEDDTEDFTMTPGDVIDQEIVLDENGEYIDDEGVRWTRERTKPTMSIMTDYLIVKSRFNHFQKLSDVKSKDDRSLTVNELTSQHGIQEKASGWKLLYICSQLEDMIESEQEMEERIENLKGKLVARVNTCTCLQHDYNKLLELVRGNLQRCQVVQQQLNEANGNLLKLLKHRPKIKDIINKNAAKRAIKKKERL